MRGYRTPHAAAAREGAQSVTWTEFSGKGADSKWQRSALWGDLIERIRSAEGFATKAACPWLKLASFGDARTAKGALRHDANVVAIFGVEGDYDAGEMTPDEAVAKLEAALVRAVVYTSPSHTPQRPRWRVIAPTSRAMHPEARAALVARLNGVLGGALAVESFTLSQSYYFGRTDDAVEYRVLVTFDDPYEGRCIDELDELDTIAIGRRANGSKAGANGHERIKWADFIAEVERGESLHARMASLTASLARRRVPRELIRATACGILERARAARGARVDELAGEELDRLIDSAIAKYSGADGASADESATTAIQSQGGGGEIVELDDGVELLPPDFSDDALAIQLVSRGGGRYRWSPGLGWMVDSGAVWRRDEQLTRYDLARRVCRAAALGAKGEPERRRLASAKTVAAVLSLAQSDQRIVVPASVWDADPTLLNTPHGLVDLRTGEMRTRGSGVYVTQIARVAPDFEGRAPVFQRFMLEVFGGDVAMVEFMQRALGYCLSGDTREQMLMFWHGGGGNGKSTLLDLVHWLLDTYAVKLPAAALMVQRNERHPTDIASLRGKRLAVSSELDEGQFWNEALIKELTGDEVLTARFMRQDSFEFKTQHKHVIVGNHKPRLRGSDHAIARRMLLVPFTQKFDEARRDKGMLDKLKAEAPAILAWMVRGAVQWFADGLGVPAVVRDASADYIAEHDDVALWMDERCIRSGEAKASELYQSFSDWKRQRGEHAPSATTWFQRLQAVPGIGRRKSSGIVYVGVRLNDHEAARIRYAQL